MADLHLARWIRELDENGAVGLARSLIFAEAGARGLPLDEHSMSGRVKTGDQGIDGRTDFPADSGTLLPVGRRIWQVKSGSTSPSATTEFDRSKHEALFKAIEDGHGYVLFWTNDPVDPTSTTVKTNFTAEVRKVREDAEVTFLFADAIERLCLAHLGVLAQGSPYPFPGLVSLDVWGAQDDYRSVAFQADDPRARMLEVLREHVASEAAEPSVVHVVGDTGLGKSRLVHEALSQDGLAQRVLVAPDASAFDNSLLTLVAQEPERRVVLVVDDCEAEERKSLTRYADMARGRIRLVTIGSRSSRERQAQDARFLEVMPLAVAASQEIAASQGLNDADARMVAEFTEGYPGLALNLAKAFRFGEATESLIDRVRGHEEVGGVLASLLPEEDVVPLGMLALFEKLGFDGDLATELSIACEVLDVDETLVRRISDRELRRFVSEAGRFRRVTPRLFALWLASEFMRERGDALVSALSALPATLRERILEQMDAFAGDPIVAKALSAILTDAPFLDGALANVDDGAARFLHVSAIAAPSAAIDAIERILRGIGFDELAMFGSGRREMVWALELLLWYDDIYERAATALLRLAIAENETWSNNATGVLQGSFRIFLGGTSVPYSRRVEWARSAMAEYGDRARALLIPGLGLALDPHESRSSPSFGGRAAPEEWRPRLVQDEIDARAAAWDLLLDVARDFEEDRVGVADALSRGIRTALRRGLSDQVVADLPDVPWPTAARAVLGNALAKALEYEEMPADLEERLRSASSAIQGDSIGQRLAYVLALSPWDLAEDREDMQGDSPRIIKELAAALIDAGRPAAIDAAKISIDRNQQTAFSLFVSLAERDADQALLEDVCNLDPLPEAAVLGTFSGLANSLGAEWVDQVLREWSTSPRFGSLVVRAAHLSAPTEARADIAIAAVDAGWAAPAELGQFLYGAWASSLPASTVAEIASRLIADGSAQAAEHAMGIISHWLEKNSNEPPPDGLMRVALDAIIRSADYGDDASSMLTYYRSQLLGALPIPFEVRLQIAIASLSSLTSFADDGMIELLGGLAREDTAATTRAVLGLLSQEEARGFNPAEMWLQDAHVLSQLERAGEPEVVIQVVLSEIEKDRWRDLVNHIDLQGPEPDPLLVVLLDRAEEQTLQGRAIFKFMHPQTAFTGPESENLRARLALAARWLSESEPGTGFHSWLTTLLVELEAQIARAEFDEAERGY